jgi:N-formylglutamate amidohydrolase
MKEPTELRGPRTVIHIPHASTVIPADVRRAFVLSDAELEQELLRLTDRYTDELFDLRSELARPVVYGVSRFVTDPERFPDDAHESMAARGMGAVYVSTTDGAPSTPTASRTSRFRATRIRRDRALTSASEQTHSTLLPGLRSKPRPAFPTMGLRSSSTVPSAERWCRLAGITRTNGSPR